MELSWVVGVRKVVVDDLSAAIIQEQK